MLKAQLSTTPFWLYRFYHRFSRPEKYFNDYNSVIKYLSDCRECDKYCADIRKLSKRVFASISWLYLNFIDLPSALRRLMKNIVQIRIIIK